MVHSMMLSINPILGLPWNCSLDDLLLLTFSSLLPQMPRLSPLAMTRLSTPAVSISHHPMMLSINPILGLPWNCSLDDLLLLTFSSLLPQMPRLSPLAMTCLSTLAVSISHGPFHDVINPSHFRSSLELFLG